MRVGVELRGLVLDGHGRDLHGQHPGQLHALLDVDLEAAAGLQLREVIQSAPQLFTHVLSRHKKRTGKAKCLDNPMWCWTIIKPLPDVTAEDLNWRRERDKIVALQQTGFSLAPTGRYGKSEHN